MSVCVDCKEEVKYGEGWGGSGVCTRCRAKRANKSRRDREKAAGRSTGTRKKEDW